MQKYERKLMYNAVYMIHPEEKHIYLREYQLILYNQFIFLLKSSV